MAMRQLFDLNVRSKYLFLNFIVAAIYLIFTIGFKNLPYSGIASNVACNGWRFSTYGIFVIITGCINAQCIQLLSTEVLVRVIQDCCASFCCCSRDCCCLMLDRCFHYDHRRASRNGDPTRECGCQFALLHRADPEHYTTHH